MFSLFHIVNWKKDIISQGTRLLYVCVVQVFLTLKTKCSLKNSKTWNHLREYRNGSHKENSIVNIRDISPKNLNYSIIYSPSSHAGEYDQSYLKKCPGSFCQSICFAILKPKKGYASIIKVIHMAPGG